MITNVEMEIVTAGLCTTTLDVNLVTRLYNQMHELPTPTFTVQQIRLLCLAFKIRLVSHCQDGPEYVFSVKSGVIGAMEIKTK